MYIYPNTDIYLLNGVSLNADYDHTIYFTSLDLQSTFFLSHTKYSLSNNYYVRKERGYIQVEKNQNDLWDCSYMMYRNTSYKNKWFYAFITSVDYVNDNVSLIHFEIDVIQTWWSECTLDKCFVEREHSSTDELFENTIPEKLDSGDFYNAQIIREFYFTPSRLCLIATTDNQNVSASPFKAGNLFTGLNYSSFDLSTSSGVRDAVAYIKEYIANGFEDNVVAIFQYPEFIGRITELTTYYETSYTMTYNFSNVDGYAPKNKKLFTFPYNYLSVSDKEGNAIDLKWELWNSSHIGEFKIEASVYGKACVSAIPLNYRDILTDYESSIIYDNFPICAWVGDAFQVWLAQNKGGLIASSVGAIATGVSSVIALGGGDLASGGRLAASSISQIMGILGSMRDAENMPPKMHGNLSSSVLNIQNGSKGFEFKQMTIKSEYAKIIDEYFSRYGYATHRIKVPNRNARQNWTYVKTIGCEITGNIPSDDAVKIRSIYDRGITFWNNGNNIGNYGDFTNPVYS